MSEIHHRTDTAINVKYSYAKSPIAAPLDLAQIPDGDHCALCFTPPGRSVSLYVVISAPWCVVQDLQSEIEAHQHAFESINTTGRHMVRNAETKEEGPELQERLDTMNQRWVQLKTKSVEIRSVFLFL